MKFDTKWAGSLALSAVLLAGCDQLSGGSPIAVLDLGEVAKATGQDEEIRSQAETARADLGSKLQQLAVSLDQQLIAEREKIGAKPTAADEQRLQEMTQQARQQINNAQIQAQNEAGQIEADLVEKFREKVDPLAEKIARERGAKALIAADSYLFWHDEEINITDEVIAAWKALPAEEPAEGKAAEAPAATDAAPVAAPAETPAAAAPETAPAPDAAATAPADAEAAQ